MAETTAKVLIIGSGPAGLAAALYAARANLEPVVITGMELGGQVSITHHIENYPGFPDGIGGQELVKRFQQQAERFGAEIIYDSATAVDFSSRSYRVTTYGDVYQTHSVIIATGATPVHLDVPGESEFTGKGVSYCATCDGHFFQDKDVVVVGGGDSALEEALFLTRYAQNVTIIHRRDSLRAHTLLKNRAFSNEKIRFIWNTTVEEIVGDGVVKAVLLHNNQNGEKQRLATDGVFIFIGHRPNTELFQNELTLDEQGYIVTDKFLQTNIPGVFAAGEVADPHFKQVITSAGMGAAAAMQLIHYLEEKQE